MPTTMDPLRIRRRLDRKIWAPPTEFGPDGWRYLTYDRNIEILVSYAPHPTDGGTEWLHASIVRADRMPDYHDLTFLHRAVFAGGGYAYQVFAPPSQHVNIHDQCLHLWGRLDGQPVLPEFGQFGTI